MSRVRLLVGYSQGGLRATSDGSRRVGSGRAPLAGWEVYHMKGSGRARTRLCRSLRWLVRTGGAASDDGGKLASRRRRLSLRRGRRVLISGTTGPPGPGVHSLVAPRAVARRPRHSVRGAEDAALFRSTDAGQTWSELTALRGHSPGPSWQPGAGAYACTQSSSTLSTRADGGCHSAAGVFRSDDWGQNWRPANRGLCSEGNIPEAEAELGHCVHHVAMHPRDPMSCSCKSTGTSCVVMMEAIRGGTWAKGSRATSGSVSTCMPTNPTRSLSCP